MMYLMYIHVCLYLLYMFKLWYIFLSMIHNYHDMEHVFI